MTGPTEFIVRYAYGGLFAVIFIEEAGIPLPIPGDLFIAATGALARAGNASFAGAVAAVVAGVVTGSAVLYTLARAGRRPAFMRLAGWMGYTDQRRQRVETWIEKRGGRAVFIGRLTPGLRVLVSVAAGVLGLDRRRFTAAVAGAAAVWAFLLFGVGYVLGPRFQSIVQQHLVLVCSCLAGAIVTAVLVLRWRTKRQARLAPPADA